MHQELITKYQKLKDKNLSIDITRGKPDTEQLDLSNKSKVCGLMIEHTIIIKLIKFFFSQKFTVVNIKPHVKIIGITIV